MNSIKRTSAALLALLLALLAGCGGNTTWAYELDGVQAPAGLYISYITQAMGELDNEYESQHGTDPDHVHMEMKDLLKEDTMGKLNSDWVKERAAELSAEYFAIENLFGELGLSLDEEDTGYINYATDYQWDYNNSYYELNGIAKSSLKLMLTNEVKKSKVFLELYGPEGERGVPEEELKNEFSQGYAKIDLMYIYKAFSEDEEGQSVEEQNQTLKAQAEGYAERMNNGESIEDIVYEYQLENTAEDQRDEVERPEEGSRTSLVNLADAAEDDVLMNGVVAAPIGQATVIEDDYFYYLIRRHDVMGDEADFESMRDEILYGLKTDEFNDYLGERAAQLNLTVNQAAVNRYTPDKIKSVV